MASLFLLTDQHAIVNRKQGLTPKWPNRALFRSLEMYLGIEFFNRLRPFLDGWPLRSMALLVPFFGPTLVPLWSLLVAFGRQADPIKLYNALLLIRSSKKDSESLAFLHPATKFHEESIFLLNPHCGRAQTITSNSKPWSFRCSKNFVLQLSGSFTLQSFMPITGQNGEGHMATEHAMRKDYRPSGAQQKTLLGK